jgi:DNA-binding NarL/FixJ family response regulator
MDVILPNVNGIETTRQLIASFPIIKVIALSMHADDRFVSAMRDAGALGYVLKDHVLNELVTAIRTVVNGQTHFHGKPSVDSWQFEA